MEFAKPLIPGRLIRRYKRFLAEVETAAGPVTAHCPNPGSMMGLADPGTRVWLEPGRPGKLAHAWRLVELPGRWAGIDTGVPNRVVAEALAEGRIAPLAGYREHRAEVRYGRASRVDFRLDGPGTAFVEVKNVHLMRADGLAEFPDCVTRRGAKHLGELAEAAQAGARAVLLYVVQMTGVGAMRLAADLDPAYAAAAVAARAAGVEMLAWGCAISPTRIALDRPIPMDH